MASKSAPVSGSAPEPDCTDDPVLREDAIRQWEPASKLEWLVTNGIGGYASGTLAGANTRRYHAFLMAAISPPAGRVVSVARIEESVALGGGVFQLESNQWKDGSVSPQGFTNLESFRLERGIPCFTYRFSGQSLEKRVWMQDGLNATWASYTWPSDAPPAILSVKLFFASRDFHSQQHGSPDWHWKTETLEDGICVSPVQDGLRTTVRISGLGRFTVENQWYWGFLHQAERDRGLDDIEDLWVAGSLEAPLIPGGSVFLLASNEPVSADPAAGAEALKREQTRRESRGPHSPRGSYAAALHNAADAFLVRRPVSGSALPAEPNSVIAGYHWFGDWGRDTMISLPGLTLETGRPEVARKILLAYSQYVSQGMLPNRFPDSGEQLPEYNTVDATLWYFIAAHRYVEATQDHSLLNSLYSCFQDIVTWHERGTRHGIGMDPSDGLLRAGEPGIQLTWMDARIGDWVVTPRTGKPVEIQALWYNALRLMQSWASDQGDDPAHYSAAADRVSQSFASRFWVPDKGFLADVVDGPGGDDHSLRPNQLFAASLPFPLISGENAAAMLAKCESQLLTPCGLRTLDPGDRQYVGVYRGDQAHRDGAYHQGTVWPWLMGAYVDAVIAVTGDRARAGAAVQPILEQIRTAGIGYVSEIYEGDAPHLPAGCIAQAWSVAELLRSLGQVGPGDAPSK